MSFDSIAALVRELSTEEQRILVDSDNRPAIKQFLSRLQPSSLLTQVTTIKVQPTTKLVARDFFKVNTKKNTPVKISYVWDSFKEWFLTKTEELPTKTQTGPRGGPYRTPGQNGSDEVSLRYHTLNRNSVDGPIIEQLGGEAKAETTIAEIAALMTKQGNHENDALLTNGYANIFYVRDVSGVLRAVSVLWNGGSWYVNTFSVEDPYGWCAGNRVFSRDS